MAQWLTNPTRNHEGADLIPGLAHGLRIWHCRELWCRSAATAPIQPLAWKLPYAVGAALKGKEKKKKKVMEFKVLGDTSQLLHFGSHE